MYHRYYTADSPSWRELEQFVLFLYEQLSALDNSDFLEPGDMLKLFPELRTLVIKLIIKMSKVCWQPLITYA